MSRKQSVDQVKEHSFDGIQEYDNQLPQWWLWTFILTVVFGFGYWLYFHVYQIGPNQSQEYAIALKDHQKKFQSTDGDQFDQKMLMTLLQDQGAIKDAEQLFKANCMACHGQYAEGLIGPNLTDKFWIHGGSAQEIFNIIKNGVAEKGMVAWKSALSDKQMQSLVAYIKTLQDTTPANAKPPEGQEYIPQ